MAVGPDGVDVEGVGKGHLANANLKPAQRHLCRQRKRTALLVHHLVRQTDDLVNLAAREIGRGAQGGVAHHVEIQFARKSQRLRDSAPAGILKVDNQVSVVAAVGMS